MNLKATNLNNITKKYRLNSKSDKGFELLINLIENSQTFTLESLLRNHILEPITLPSEIESRENVDSLLEFYSLLQISFFANYIDHPLPKKLAKEIDYILNIPAVKKYYKKNYPLLLPQLLLQQTHSDIFYKNTICPKNTALLDRFLAINEYVKNDEDIQLLLWFYNDGWIGKYSMKDLLLLLKGEYKITEQRNMAHPLNKVLWGFTKYTKFLSAYADLLRDCHNNSILQSAFWHFHSYWFNHSEDMIGQNLRISIQSIKNSFSSNNSKELFIDKTGTLPTIEVIKEWKSNTQCLDKLENDINYLFNSTLGKPLYDLNIQLNSN